MMYLKNQIIALKHRLMAHYHAKLFFFCIALLFQCKKKKKKKKKKKLWRHEIPHRLDKLNRKCFA